MSFTLARAEVNVMADTSDLGDSLDSLRYLIAVPGDFSTSYPNTTDDMLLQVLMDGMAEAQLMGLLTTFSVDDNGIVTPGLTSGQTALVVIFAAIRLIRATLLNATTQVTYKAGSAEYSTAQSANVLRDILADLKAQKTLIINTGDGPDGADTAFYMADQYVARITFGWNGHDLPALNGW